MEWRYLVFPDSIDVLREKVSALAETRSKKSALVTELLYRYVASELFITYDGRIAFGFEEAPDTKLWRETKLRLNQRLKGGSPSRFICLHKLNSSLGKAIDKESQDLGRLVKAIEEIHNLPLKKFKLDAMVSGPSSFPSCTGRSVYFSVCTYDENQGLFFVQIPITEESDSRTLRPVEEIHPECIELKKRSSRVKYGVR